MNYKEKFIHLMLEADVLRFGEFTTKSGRLSPYFVNTGNFSTGRELAKLGEIYAEIIKNEIIEDIDFLYGPAYKGIPLICSTSIALNNLYDIDLPYSFNRKEAKDHGEGGVIVSYQPKDGDRALIVEDVMTAGTSVRESVSILDAAGDIKVENLIISVDRMEIGYEGRTAIKEVYEEFGIKTYSIVTVQEIIDILYNKEINGKIYIDDKIKNSMLEYMDKYCEA